MAAAFNGILDYQEWAWYTPDTGTSVSSNDYRLSYSTEQRYTGSVQEENRKSKKMHEQLLQICTGREAGESFLYRLREETREFCKNVDLKKI